MLLCYCVSIDVNNCGQLRARCIKLKLLACDPFTFRCQVSRIMNMVISINSYVQVIGLWSVVCLLDHDR